MERSEVSGFCRLNLYLTTKACKNMRLKVLSILLLWPQVSGMYCCSNLHDEGCFLRACHLNIIISACVCTSTILSLVCMSFVCSSVCVSSLLNLTSCSMTLSTSTIRQNSFLWNRLPNKLEDFYYGRSITKWYTCVSFVFVVTNPLDAMGTFLNKHNFTYKY